MFVCRQCSDLGQLLGEANFDPDPYDIVHIDDEFDVILPLPVVLCQWSHPVRLVKAESDQGRLLYERADRRQWLQLERHLSGVLSGTPEKYGPLALRTRQRVRELAWECKDVLPRDSAPNPSILKRAAGASIWRAACLHARCLFLVGQLLHQTEGDTIAPIRTSGVVIRRGGVSSLDIAESLCG